MIDKERISWTQEICLFVVILIATLIAMYLSLKFFKIPEKDFWEIHFTTALVAAISSYFFYKAWKNKENQKDINRALILSLLTVLSSLLSIHITCIPQFLNAIFAVLIAVFLIGMGFLIPFLFESFPPK